MQYIFIKIGDKLTYTGKMVRFKGQLAEVKGIRSKSWIEVADIKFKSGDQSTVETSDLDEKEVPIQDFKIKKLLIQVYKRCWSIFNK